MYATSSEHTRVPWAAHSYNVAASDEIGHFQYCSTIPGRGRGLRRSDGRRRRHRPASARPSRSSSRSGGALASNTHFDGTSYLPDWPGTNPNQGQDRKYHADPWSFTSPLFNGTENYERIAFEADMPRIEAADFGGNCNRSTGENCVNPPEGAAFVSDLHDRQQARQRQPSARTRQPQPRLRLELRWNAPQGDDEHVRRKLHDRVRRPPAEQLPGRRFRARVPLQQLQAES